MTARPLSTFHRFLDTARRRNVFRPLSIYVGLAWLLISVGDVFFPLLSVPQAYFPYLVWLLVAGVPLVAVGAWFIGPVAPPATDSDRSKRLGLELLVVVVLVAALVTALLLHRADDGTAPGTRPDRSLAVLPFLDFSSSGDQAYFGQGLAEELLNVLAANPALRVAARTSSFQFADADRDIRRIAEQLGVRYVLEGSIRREGERLRVTAQLIDAVTGFHQWSESFDEQFDEVFAIQDRIARQIVTALELEVLERSQVRRTDPEAFRLFLAATQSARAGSLEALELAEQQFREVTMLDPDYAPAWARLGTVLANLTTLGERDQETGYAQARGAAERAVAAAPDYAGGHLQLAWLAHRVDGDLTAAFAHMQKAVDLAPHSSGLLWEAANLLLQAGRLDEAIELYEQAVERSPIYPTGRFNLGMAYKYAGRFDDAERAFKRVHSLSPEYGGLAFQLGEVALHQGRLDQVEQHWSKLTQYRATYAAALLAAARGDEAVFATQLDRLAKDFGDDRPSAVASAAAYAGDNDKAFEWLERDLAQFGTGGWGEFRLQRWLIPLHEDPRWAALLTRIGVSDPQLSALTLELPGRPFSP